MIRFICKLASALVCLVILGTALTHCSQQHSRPLSGDDVANLLQGDVAPKRVAEIVQERGIDFVLTDEIERRLRRVGATEQLIRTLRTASANVQSEMLDPRAKESLDAVQIMALLIARESSSYVANLVQQHGIGFVPQNDFFDALRRANVREASAEILISALRNAKQFRFLKRSPAPSTDSSAIVQLLLRGADFEHQNSLQQAEQQYVQALNLDPKNATLYLVWGHILVDQERTDTALAAFQKADALQPNSPVTRSNLGIIFRQKGNLDGDVREQQTAILIDPAYADGHGNLAIALLAKSDTDGAIAEFREAVRRDPDSVVWTVQLANALRTKGDLNSAILECRNAIIRKPSYYFAHESLAEALAANRDTDRAIEEFRETIRLKPDYAPSHVGLGDAYMSKNDPDNAIGEYRQAIHLVPNYTVAHMNLGWALRLKRDFDGDVREQQESVRLSPKSAVTHYVLAVALTYKNEWAQAAAEYERAISLDTNYAYAHYGRAKALLAINSRGNRDAALQELRKAAELQPANAAFQKEYQELLNSNTKGKKSR